MRSCVSHMMTPGLVSFVLLVQCGDDDNSTGSSSEGQEVRFELIPTLSPSVAAGSPQVTLTETYAFHCIDQTEADCHTNVYEDVPDQSGDWMSFPRNSLDCITLFAEVSVGEAHYSFTGTLQRQLGQGSGPFATGTYQMNDGAGGFGFGTFEFYEQQLAVGSSPVCK